MLLFFSQVFFGLYRLLRFKHKDVQLKYPEFHLSDAILQLWKINSILEFVEFIRTTLQEIFPQCNCVHCFTFNEEYLTDFYTSQKVLSDITRNKINQSNCTFISLENNDQLILKNYAALGEDVFIIHVKDPEDDGCICLLFMVCGNNLNNSPDLNSFVFHATACLSLLTKRLASERNDDDLSFVNIPGDVCNAEDAISMQMLLNDYLAKLTISEQSCIFLACKDIKQIVCQVVGDKVLHFQVYHPMDSGFCNILCNENKPCYLNEPTAKEKQHFQSLFCCNVLSALSIPIFDKSSSDTIGIVCLCNKKLQKRFTTKDVAVVTAVMQKVWPALSVLVTLQKEKKARNECEAMLQIARNLFTHLDDVGMLLGEIIQEARNLTSAERCSVFLVDKEANELVAKVFDGIVTMDESLDPRQYDFENMNEVRIPLTQGIAGHVASTGVTLNITDAYSHPLFYRGIDNTTGFRTRNILCFPIKDHNGVVVGVSQLCNKIKGSFFTSYDEELAERFAVFSGISISHSLLYKEVEETGCRSRLANELVTYHMKVDKDEIEKNLPREELTIREFHPNFDKFIYSPRVLPYDLKVKACYWMYDDLGLISKFHISKRTLIHFLLMVRKGYRNPPYHNWDHAFSVMHHAYLLAKNLQLNNKLSDLEVIALLTACVCHDLDHRGTNNAFQIDSQSVLASLYSSEGSVLERHHFAQTVCILSTAGCNIFENMKRKDYAHTLDLIKYIILATDVASHLKIIPQLEDMAHHGLDLSNFHHRKLLLALSMTACDLSDQTKNWETTKSTSKLIYKEFFSQGDLEKRMGNRPAIINDRERACVPQLQINFMEHIALPVYDILSRLFPQYEEVHKRVKMNIARWRRVEREFLSRDLPNTDSLDFLTDDFDRGLFEGLDEM